MIIKVIFAALLALSCIAPTSCSKENKQTSMNLTSESHTGRVIRYSINRTDYRCIIRNNEDWITPISNILALSREGFTIRITDENHAYRESLTKKTVTLTNKGKSEVDEWIFKKLLERYEVIVSYNDNTGEYTCIATK